MDQNSGLKAPKKLACLLVKKCGNNGLELGNFKLITLYTRKSETSVTKLTILISDRVRPQVCGAVAHAPVKSDNSNLKSIS